MGRPANWTLVLIRVAWRANFLFEREVEVALFYFGDGDGVGGAGFREGFAEEDAFGGVEEGVGGEDLFEGREGAGCGREDGAAYDSRLLGLKNVHKFAEAGSGGGVCGDESVGQEEFGFEEWEIAGRVVGLAWAALRGACNGDSAAIEDFD
jgi:hypothetical protein